MRDDRDPLCDISKIETSKIGKDEHAAANNAIVRWAAMMRLSKRCSALGVESRRRPSELERRTKGLEDGLRDRGSRLRRSKQRTQRLTQQNNRFKQQIRTLRASRAWRVLSIIHPSEQGLK
jgi:hypothetical protein